MRWLIQQVRRALRALKGAGAGERDGPARARLTDRELATVLAALRFHQDADLQGGRGISDQCIKEIATDGGLLDPLTFEEVGKLREKLNPVEDQLASKGRLSTCSCCDDNVCRGCQAECTACVETLCPTCQTECPDCGRILCADCLDEKQCPCIEECPDSKENEDGEDRQEQTDEGETHHTPSQANPVGVEGGQAESVQSGGTEAA